MPDHDRSLRQNPAAVGKTFQKMWIKSAAIALIHKKWSFAYCWHYIFIDTGKTKFPKYEHFDYRAVTD